MRSLRICKTKSEIADLKLLINHEEHEGHEEISSSPSCSWCFFAPVQMSIHFLFTSRTTKNGKIKKVEPFFRAFRGVMRRIDPSCAPSQESVRDNFSIPTRRTLCRTRKLIDMRISERTPCYTATKLLIQRATRLSLLRIVVAHVSHEIKKTYISGAQQAQQSCLCCMRSVQDDLKQFLLVCWSNNSRKDSQLSDRRKEAGCVIRFDGCIADEANKWIWQP